MALAFWGGAALGIVLHEAAHAIAARSYGLRVKGMRVRWFGVGVVRQAGTPAQNAAIAFAGPAANLLLAVLFARSPEFAAANLALGITNLFPLPGLDGWRVWQSMKAFLRARSACATSNAQTGGRDGRK